MPIYLKLAAAITALALFIGQVGHFLHLVGHRDHVEPIEPGLGVVERDLATVRPLAILANDMMTFPPPQMLPETPQPFIARNVALLQAQFGAANDVIAPIDGPQSEDHEHPEPRNLRLVAESGKYRMTGFDVADVKPEPQDEPSHIEPGGNVYVALRGESISVSAGAAAVTVSVRGTT